MSLTKSDINQTIPDLFERQVLQHPNHTAFEHGEIKVSYRDLSRRVNEIASIVTNHKPNREHPVLVFLEPGLSSVAAFLGILRAGAICALVDRSNPQTRLATIIGNLRPGLCLTDQGSFEAAQDLAGGKFPVVLMDRPDGLPKLDDNFRLERPESAVIVYTSGSTGVPKGVLHNQQSLVHIVWLHTRRFKLGPTDRTLFLPSSTGITVVLVILRTLLTGGTLVQFPGEALSGQELSRVINANRITSMTMVPSLFREIMTSLEETARLSKLRSIILSGEPLTAEDVKHFQQHCGLECILLNAYGCTEIPTFRTYPIDMNTMLPWPQVPVGYAEEDKEVVLIDEDGEPVTPGEEGEIAVRSAFMAIGYWRNPEETARRFIPPIETGGLRMYRTGDWGYFLESGVLACTGRRDQQVKVLGNRVELGEIEKVLCQHPRVQRAAIIAKTTPAGATLLVAFVVGEECADESETELRKFLLSRLPTYMIPARISNVASLPLTPNGKIDREALRALDPENANRTELPPQTQTSSLLERSLLKIWKEVLGIEQVGLHDNFFELGGHSLLATRVMSRVRQEFHVDLQLMDFFKMPTIAELSKGLKGLLWVNAGKPSENEAELQTREEGVV
jgi:amino acid adenylation domain-containing protein